jgi:streptogramin lyase
MRPRGLASLLAFLVPVPSNLSSFCCSAGGITQGPDGNVWFVEYAPNRIGRITPSGAVTEFAIRGSYGSPNGIVTGPDGNLWFTLETGAIARMDPGTHGVTEFPTGFFGPDSITVGPDGNLWFTGLDTDTVWRITTDGTITPFTIPGFYQHAFITSGPDDNLWFTEIDVSGTIWRLTTDGAATRFTGVGGQPEGITAGPDGSLWFTAGDVVGKITTTGVITEYLIPWPYSFALGITPDPSGYLWFADGTERIGRVDLLGNIVSIRTPTRQSHPEGIVRATDGRLWFIEDQASSIGRLTAG